MFLLIFGSTAYRYIKKGGYCELLKSESLHIKTLDMHLTLCMISSWLMEQHKKKTEKGKKRNRF